MIIAIVLISIIAGICYRAGGTGGGPWYLNTKMRDIGVSLCGTIILFLLGYRNPIALILTCGLTFASLTTYNKWFGRLFGFNDGDVHWPSWAITGLTYGLAALPIAICYGLWIPWVVRSLVLAVFICLWSEFIDDVTIEEGGRGFLYAITFLMFSGIKPFT